MDDTSGALTLHMALGLSGAKWPVAHLAMFGAAQLIAGDPVRRWAVAQKARKRCSVRCGG